MASLHELNLHLAVCDSCRHVLSALLNEFPIAEIHESMSGEFDSTNGHTFGGMLGSSQVEKSRDVP